jgi:AcrR family transcriptional regulator
VFHEYSETDRCMARTYNQKKRAESRQKTRQRIIEAAVELHEAVGEAGATVTAIAERAGVGRLTVYRHFPDDRALVEACTSHYFAAHPPPDPVVWGSTADPEVRLEAALAELYAYYHQTEGMFTRAEQVSLSNPMVAEVLAPYAGAWARMRDILLVGLLQGDESDALLTATVGHALAFATWRSLVREQQLDDGQAITVIMVLVRGLRR